jgi:hypothetical protein
VSNFRAAVPIARFWYLRMDASSISENERDWMRNLRERIFDFVVQQLAQRFDGKILMRQTNP